MINSFSFKYSYLGIIQQYFQPKIGRKKNNIQPGPGKQHSYKKKKDWVYQTEETGANKTYLLLAALK